MNLKNAAGRNWTRTPRKPVPPRLGGQTDQSGPSLPTWLERRGDEYHKAPGRNWARERNRPRPVHLEHDQETLIALLDTPAREQGAGDHDQPYRYVEPNSAWTFPFTTREYARLLALRARLALEAEGQSGYHHDDFVGGRRERLIRQA